jgi:hypothetical protein
MAKKITTRWLASISDGSIALEGKAPFHVIPGELSPWLRLQRYLADNKLRITGLRIQVEVDGQPIRTYNSPSLSPKSRWSYLNPVLPIRFDYFRRYARPFLAMDVKPGGSMEGIQATGPEEKHIEIHTIYPGFTLITIVEETEGNESWTVIIPNTEIKAGEGVGI